MGRGVCPIGLLYVNSYKPMDSSLCPMGKHFLAHRTSTCEVLSGHGLVCGPTGFEEYPMGPLDTHIGEPMDTILSPMGLAHESFCQAIA